MGILMKIADAITFVFLLIVSLGGPLLDGQLIIPSKYFPELLIKYNDDFIRDNKHYLQVDRPAFYMALIWFHILVNAPVAVVCLYGFIFRKSWFSKICLALAVSFSTNMVPILGELLESGKAADALVKMYFSLLSVAILVIFRNLIALSPASAKTKTA